MMQRVVILDESSFYYGDRGRVLKREGKMVLVKPEFHTFLGESLPWTDEPPVWIESRYAEEYEGLW